MNNHTEDKRVGFLRKSYESIFKSQKYDNKVNKKMDEEWVLPAMNDYVASIVSTTEQIEGITEVPESISNTIHNNAIQSCIDVVNEVQRGVPMSRNISDMISSPYSKIISKLHSLKK